MELYLLPAWSKNLQTNSIRINRQINKAMSRSKDSLPQIINPLLGGLHFSYCNIILEVSSLDGQWNKNIIYL